jgi:DNA helicase-2/ATP-dependent DNA helicase PcrA
MKCRARDVTESEVCAKQVIEKRCACLHPGSDRVDKSLIFAVAGSGKTTRIVEQLDLNRRVLLLTYTESNYAHLRRKIIEKFTYFPDNVTLRTYFTFLHGFCYRPLLQMQLRSRGVNFQIPPVETAKFALTNDARFLDGSRRLYHNRLAKLLVVKGCIPELLKRVERYFDAVFIDEVQDFAGHDFNLLLAICQANIEVLLVGDFYQHTFDTSRDGAVNGRLHESFAKYEKRFLESGITVDKQSLIKSRRCGKAVCDFIRERLHIDVHSHSGHLTQVANVDSQARADKLYADPAIVKLFFEEHHRYNCYSQNWGGSKGLDHFQDVCVVMNPGSWKRHLHGTLHELAPLTRNKLYVACSRARGDLFFAPDVFFTAHRVQ